MQFLQDQMQYAIADLHPQVVCDCELGFYTFSRTYDSWIVLEFSISNHYWNQLFLVAGS
jgi:hypothetical protein